MKKWSKTDLETCKVFPIKCDLSFRVVGLFRGYGTASVLSGIFDKEVVELRLYYTTTYCL